jgi:hypothetical protein
LLKEKPEEMKPRTKVSSRTAQGNDLLEEILDTSRNTQRLLGNTDTKLHKSLDELQSQVSQMVTIQDHQRLRDSRRPKLHMHPMMVDEMLMMSEELSSRDGRRGRDISPFYLPMVLSPWKHDFPWLYDAASNLATILMSEADGDTKKRSIEDFASLIEMLGRGHPMFRELLGKGQGRMAMELHMLTQEFLARWSHRHLTGNEEPAE